MTSQKNIVRIGWLIAALLIAYAFALIGSPAENRKRMEDRAQVKLLKEMDCSIAMYYTQSKRPPQSLEELESSLQNIGTPSTRGKCGWCNRARTLDVKEFTATHRPEYTAQQDSYKICVAFNRNNEESFEAPYTEDSVFNNYKAGMNCFERKLKLCE